MELPDAKSTVVGYERKEWNLRQRIAIATHKLEQCTIAVGSMETDFAGVKVQNTKGHEKLKRITALCMNLKQSHTKSKADEDKDKEHNRRAQLRYLFDAQLKDISARIEQSTVRKTTQMEAKLQLNLQLQQVLEAFSSLEKEADSPELKKLEADLLHVDESMALLHELQLMELEDYSTKVLDSIEKQFKIKQKIAHQSESFDGLQQQLVENNNEFENYRKRITDATEMVKESKTQKANSSMELKTMTRKIKQLATTYAECVSELEKEKVKKEKLAQLVSVLEDDIIAKEQGII